MCRFNKIWHLAYSEPIKSSQQPHTLLSDIHFNITLNRATPSKQ
jgi:hypothetical protein